LGNNCQAGAVFQDGLVRSPRNDTLDFQYPYEPDTGTVNDNLDAAVTQIFYTVNMLHDLYYLLGFTPAAGNFQDDNHGEGGYGRDRVYVILRYWGERNNGFFEQKPDGAGPALTLLLFDFTDPVRDGAFDIGFVIHEYTHGRKCYDQRSSWTWIC
jgi:extracellular elastinolytic metalloproteinase